MTWSRGVGSVLSRISQRSSTACTWPSPGRSIRCSTMRSSRPTATTIVSPLGPFHGATQTPRPTPKAAFRTTGRSRNKVATNDNHSREKAVRGGAESLSERFPKHKRITRRNSLSTLTLTNVDNAEQEPKLMGIQNLARVGSQIVFATLLFACAQYTPPQTAPTRQALSVTAPFSATWSAAVDVFAENNIPIETIDRSSGLMVPAAGLYLGSAMDTTYADCGARTSAYRERLLPRGGRYNIRVKGDSSTSNVQVFAAFVSDNYACVSTGKWERGLERAIKARAESHPAER